MTAVDIPQKHVLIAEDDDEDFFIFSFAVKETKIAVALDRAENGEILMEKLRGKIPDILFLDIEMPCRDGHQCIQDIRGDKRYDGMPVIIYSSFEDIRNIEHCFREGANLYVVKPTYFSEFVETIRQLLEIDHKTAMYYPSRSNFVLRQQPRSG